MAMRAAFIFIAPEADPSQHRAEVLTPEVELVVHAVKNYADACTLAKQLVADGIIAIELCGGFGSEGVAQVTRAVAGPRRGRGCALRPPPRPRPPQRRRVLPLSDQANS